MISRPRLGRNLIVTAHDIAMAAVSFPLAAWLRLGDQLPDGYIATGTMLFTAVSAGVFFSFRLHRGLWRYASVRDLAAILRAATFAVLTFALVMFVVNRLQAMPRSVLFIQWMLLVCLLGGSRLAWRAYKEHGLSLKRVMQETRKIPVLLVGTGDAAEQFIRDLARDARSPYEPVGLIGNNPKQQGGMIRGVPIRGNTDGLAAVVRRLEQNGKRPQKLILTDSRADGATVQCLLRAAEGLGIPLARLPRLSEFKPGIGERLELKPVAVEDLLGRAQHVLDREGMRTLVEGRKVLVTGAGGTIGGELTRQVAAFRPSELILLELSEFNLYQIEREIRGAFPDLALTVTLSDARNARHIDATFRRHCPDLVFHAAAIKHVPIAEVNIEEAILTNVFGTRHVAESCQRHGASAMVLISTDKAVNPTNVMGASKRLAENFCQALGSLGGHTQFITVRFGNVLGSTGSVVPLFAEQLAKGGPLTVTHPEITRYFMTVREAVELVLQAAVLGVDMKEKREGIFVLDMGQPMRILDLAAQMIRLAGLKPHEDIKIVFTGLRPGEKLHEELFHQTENAQPTAHGGITLAAPRFTDLPTLAQALEALLAACQERKPGEALLHLKRLVPEYQSAFSSTELLTA